MRRLRSIASLLRWLGPWTRDDAVPLGIQCSHWVIREGSLQGLRAHHAETTGDSRSPVLDAYVYEPSRAPLGVYVVSPGLHFAGPDDPRFDRFCRVLATAGFVVIAPFLASYVNLNVAPSAVADLEAVLLATRERFASLGRPTLFSISFGSFPAFEVAARRPDDVDAVITFGGYADFESVARFCIDGVMHDDDGAHPMAWDPLNRPALFLHLLPHLGVEGDTSPLARAWTTLCYRTWGKMELKEPGKLDPYVDALEAELPEAQRELFRIGVTNHPRAGELLELGLARGAEHFEFISPRAAIANLRCPVVVCHGRDDDVIPWGESVKLDRALAHVPHRLLLTGLFAHTGAGRVSPRDVAREAANLVSIVRVLANGGAVARMFP